jgi:hypothetical protein
MSQHLETAVLLEDVVVATDAEGQAEPISPSSAPWDRQRPSPGVHPTVFKILFGLFATMMSAYLITFWGSGYARFMVVISWGYVLIYCAVPFVLLKQQAQPERCAESFAEFLRRPFETNTGTITGLDATIQICVIPAAATVCSICLCVVYSVV